MSRTTTSQIETLRPTVRGYVIEKSHDVLHRNSRRFTRPFCKFVHLLVPLIFATTLAAQELSLSLDPQVISENGEKSTITANLSEAANTKITVTVSAVAIAPATDANFKLSRKVKLVIAAGETSSKGKVTVTAIDDNIDEGEKLVTVSGAVSGNNGISDPTDQTLRIYDEDRAGLIFSKWSMNIPEGEKKKYSVKLASKPTGDVTVEIENPAPDVISISPKQLQFTPSGGKKWRKFQTVRVRGKQDEDATDESVAISHVLQSDADPKYNGPVSRDVQVAVTDDDAKLPELSLSLAPSAIEENGGSSTVKAHLNTASSVNTLVTISASAISPATEADYTLSDNVELTIAAGETDSSGTVTIVGVPNDVSNGGGGVRISGTAVNSVGVNAPPAITLSIVDDDTRGIAVLPNRLVITEGNDATYTVQLTAKPNGTVTVTPTLGSSDSDVSVSGALSFDAQSWDETQTVTVTSVADADDTDDTVTIGHTVSGADYDDVVGPDLTVDVVEPPPVVTLTLDPRTIGEYGRSSTVTAQLSRASNAPATVTISVTPTAPATDADYELSENVELVIAAGETTSTGEVTVTAVDNEVDEGGKQLTISGSVASAMGLANPRDAILSIWDEDRAGLIFDTRAIELSEGSRDSYTVKLASQPTGSVTVNVQSSDEDAATVKPSRLEFTVDGRKAWHKKQTVRVRAKQDDDMDDESVSVSHSLESSEDPKYNGDVAGALQVTVVDDDYVAPQVTLLLAPQEISENGGSSVVTASLDRASSADTTVTISTSAISPTTEADYVLSDNVELTIVAGETASSGEVKIVGVPNDTDNSGGGVRVSGTASNSAGVTAPPAITLSIVDDDTRGIAVVPNRLVIVEGNDGRTRFN